MIRKIPSCLVSIASCVVLIAQDMDPRQVLPIPGDTVRAAEIQARAALESISQHSREAQARQEIQRREFEVRFNQLVRAAASFAQRYNEGHGSSWPQREADELRKAMSKLQSLEKSMRADLEQQKREPSARTAR